MLAGHYAGRADGTNPASATAMVVLPGARGPIRHAHDLSEQALNLGDGTLQVGGGGGLRLRLRRVSAEGAARYPTLIRHVGLDFTAPIGAARPASGAPNSDLMRELDERHGGWRRP